MKNLMNITNARSESQLQKMRELQKKKVCLFCRKNIEKHGKSEILKEGKYWLVRYNDFPYQGSKTHLMVVYKKHIDSLDKVSKNSMIELLEMIKWSKKKFQMQGASLILRFGDNRYTGATITHLHGHIVSGAKKRTKSEPIFTVVGFKK